MRHGRQVRARVLALFLASVLGGAVCTTSAHAKGNFRAVALPAADATAQVPVGWTVGSQNAAVAQLFRPGREAPLVLQGVDASSPVGAMVELSTTLTALGLRPEHFADVDGDGTLKGALVFSGSVAGADGQTRGYYGIVRLSGFGGGVAVWALGVALDEKDWRDVAGIARRVTFKKPPAPKLQTHRVGIPGLGVIVEVPARGFVVQREQEGSLVLAAPKPMRHFSVELVSGMSDDTHDVVRALLRQEGVVEPEVFDLEGGGAYGIARSAVVIGDHDYDVIVFARSVANGIGYRGMYAVRFDMDDARQKQGLELIASTTAKPEPKSAAARAAEATLGGKYLLAGLGSSSNSMSWDASASTSEQWTFCSDRSYAYDYQSVISLGEFGGSVKEDRHSGRWVVVDGSDGGLLLLLQPRDRGRMRLPLVVKRDGIFINGNGFRFGRSDRCR